MLAVLSAVFNDVFEPQKHWKTDFIIMDYLSGLTSWSEFSENLENLSNTVAVEISKNQWQVSFYLLIFIGAEKIDS